MVVIDKDREDMTMATRGGAKEARSSGSRFAQLRVPDAHGMLVVWRSNRTGGGCGPAARSEKWKQRRATAFLEEVRTKKRTDEVDRNRKLACADWRGRGDQTLAGGANDDARCR